MAGGFGGAALGGTGGGILGGSAGGAIGSGFGWAVCAQMSGSGTSGGGNEAGGSSEYEDATKGSSIRNRKTNVTVKQFGENLEANGFTKSAKGDVTIFTKGDTQYTVYSQARSTGGPTAQVKIGGEVVGKIRLQP